MLTQSQRLAVAAEARTWLGTPYHSNQGIKGVGVDCGWLLAKVYDQTVIAEAIDLGEYAREWHMHHAIDKDASGARLPEQEKEQIYVGWLEKFCEEITGAVPQAGDIALYYYHLAWSHGGIFVNEHDVIHSYVRHGVILTDTRREHPLAGLQYRLWGVR